MTPSSITTSGAELANMVVWMSLALAPGRTKQDRSSAFLGLGGGVKIILVGVSKNDLSAADFLSA
ncbi:hypothetical protein FHS85_004375 [Rhodoligotrophos appendicifer]|uniref:hypothetical protein n=1 Tax=Rhodoligotrophos appendicifer TaxID=987056 RepID=UPI0011851C62|nr:hypothetical protein [Rhodoligotrophos appendicifer]